MSVLDKYEINRLISLVDKELKENEKRTNFGRIYENFDRDIYEDTQNRLRTIRKKLKEVTK